jgi:hypothetical protein
MTFIAGRWWHNRPTVKGVLVVVAVVLSGCYGLPTGPRPPDGTCPFPPVTHFAYIGDASGAALGIPGASGRVRHWWVSSERLTQRWRPLLPNVPIPPPMRTACGISDDGSGEIGTVPDDWHPPFDAGNS